jgi:hypothetical protein
MWVLKIFAKLVLSRLRVPYSSGARSASSVTAIGKPWSACGR